MRLTTEPTHTWASRPTTDETSALGPTLLSLPMEIQIEIFKYLLGRITITLFRNPDKPWQVSDNVRMHVDEYPHQIFSVCKAISATAHWILKECDVKVISAYDTHIPASRNHILSMPRLPKFIQDRVTILDDNLVLSCNNASPRYFPNLEHFRLNADMHRHTQPSQLACMGAIPAPEVQSIPATTEEVLAGLADDQMMKDAIDKYRSDELRDHQLHQYLHRYENKTKHCKIDVEAATYLRGSSNRDSTPAESIEASQWEYMIHFDVESKDIRKKYFKPASGALLSCQCAEQGCVRRETTSSSALGSWYRLMKPCKYQLQRAT